MHLRCPCTAAMATADPPAPTEHIGSERAHARGLPAMLQLCSPSMSRPAQIKDQLDRERLDGSTPGLQCKVRNVDAHLAIQRPDGAVPRARSSFAFASVDPIISTYSASRRAMHS